MTLNQETYFGRRQISAGVVGHSYICYGPLTAGVTTVVFEGKPVGTPDAAAYWRVISSHKVSALFTAPTAFRAIKREDPSGDLRGSMISPAFGTFSLRERGQTRIRSHGQNGNSAFLSSIIGGKQRLDGQWRLIRWGIERLPVKRGSPAVAVPGYDLKVLDDTGAEAKRGELGSIAAKLPLPPGALSSLCAREERFFASYLSKYPGHYNTGDAGYMDEDGYLYVMARTDDVINVAGHRLIYRSNRRSPIEPQRCR